MRTETIVFKSGANFNYAVHVEGLSDWMRYLKEVDPELRTIVQKNLKEAAQPVLTRARANARRIADDGTFANSMSIRSRASGTVVLASNDVAAGVKEFAHRGATYHPRANDKRPNARKMNSFPVGVPKGNPPRAMVPAVNDSIDEVRVRIERKIQEVLGNG